MPPTCTRDVFERGDDGTVYSTSMWFPNKDTVRVAHKVVDWNKVDNKVDAMAVYKVASYIGEEVPVACYQYLDFDTKQDRRIVYSMTPMDEHRKYVHTFSKRRDEKVAENQGRAALDDRVNHVLDGLLAEECGIARTGVMEDPKYEERLSQALDRIRELEVAPPARGAVNDETTVSLEEYEELREKNKDLIKQGKAEQRKLNEEIAKLQVQVNNLKYAQQGREEEILTATNEQLQETVDEQQFTIDKQKATIRGLNGSVKRLSSNSNNGKNTADAVKSKR